MEIMRRVILVGFWMLVVGAVGTIFTQSFPFLLLLALSAVVLGLGFPIQAELSKRSAETENRSRHNDLVDQIKALSPGPLARFGHLADNAGILGIVEETNTLLVLMAGGRMNVIQGKEILGAEIQCKSETIYTTKTSGVGVAVGSVAFASGQGQTTGRTVVRSAHLCLELDRIQEPLLKLPFLGIATAEPWFAVVKALMRRAEQVSVEIS